MPEIDEALVRALLAEQLPQFARLPVRAVPVQGWDNRSFRVGDEFVARLPSQAAYEAQVQVEHVWLPKLASHLPLEIPVPLALGQPGCGYPFAWSLRRWIGGETVAAKPPVDMLRFAHDLAEFLNALRRVPAQGGPAPGKRNFHRGGRLQVYDAQFREAMGLLGSRIDALGALQIWESALATQWQGAPVWVHGDIAPGNLLMREGKLSAVIDFGQTCVGDPACDCAIAWTVFSDESREAFHQALALDDDTWLRGQAWALWKAAILASGLRDGTPVDKEGAHRTLTEPLASPSK